MKQKNTNQLLNLKMSRNTHGDKLRDSIIKRMNRPTQAQLAKKLKYSPSYIGHILTGRRKPRNLDTILKKIEKELR